MKFTIDAQLPDALARHLIALGHDALHVKRMPDGGNTSDAEIIAFADQEGRAVVTKDNDFRYGHEVNGRPARLLYIGLGNMRNRDLLAHITAHHTEVVTAFGLADFVELTANGLTLHRRHPTASKQIAPP